MNTVLITGTSKGLGEGFADFFLQNGDQVIGYSRSENQVLNAHDNFKHQPVDFQKLDAIEDAITKSLVGVEYIELLILNAGVIGEIKTMTDSSISAMKKVMDINLWANKVILDTILQKGIKVNQVVAISSGASVNGSKGWSGYSISKAAMNMLIKLYAVEYTSTHFTALAPGLIDTEMQDYLCEKVNDKDFPSIQRLRSARGTEAMPNGKEAAQKIALILPALLTTPSGNYEDIRKLTS